MSLKEQKRTRGNQTKRGERGRGKKVALLNNFLPNYATAMKFRERKTQNDLLSGKVHNPNPFLPFYPFVGV